MAGAGEVEDVWDALIVLADATEFHKLADAGNDRLSVMIEGEREIHEMRELIKPRYKQLKAWMEHRVWPKHEKEEEEEDEENAKKEKAFRERFEAKVEASLAMLEEFLPYVTKP
jgi:hypothetical protein